MIHRLLRLFFGFIFRDGDRYVDGFSEYLILAICENPVAGVGSFCVRGDQVNGDLGGFSWREVLIDGDVAEIV